MRAIVYRGPGEVVLADVPRPTLQDATDAIVKVTLAGLCGTDLHVIRGDFPGMAPGMVLGHEFVGEVVEAGSALQRIRVGDRVMSSDFTACGHCRWCDRADHWHCEQRAFFGTGTAFGPLLAGAQAEYVRVPYADRTLGTMPPGLSDEAALLMGDNLATAWVAMERAGLAPGDRVVVIGGGAVGQLAALSAQQLGAGIVVVVEPNAARRAFARAQGSLGVTPEDALPAVAGVTDGDGADVVVEAVGASATMDLALDLVRPRGQVVSVGAHSAEHWRFPVARAFREELTVGFAIGDGIRLRRTLSRLLAGAAFDPTVVIDARGSLADVPALYRQLAAQERLKAVVTP